MESILTSIKKLIGFDEDYTHFDSDLMIHINGAFATLRQMGVGPKDGYMITSKDNTWNEFIGDTTKFELVKTYVYLKVRLVFDPPTSSFVLSAIKEQADEAAYRLHLASETDCM